MKTPINYGASGDSRQKKPVLKWDHRPKDEREADDLACWLHNNSAAVARNTERDDATWLARHLYERTASFGSLDSVGFMSHLSNDDFRLLGLLPSRQWTVWRWDSLPAPRKAAWLRLAVICIATLPAFFERIGHRGMEQAKAMHVIAGQFRRVKA